MSSHCKSSGVNLRGHVKIHKSVDIAKRQMAMGSIGVTVATEAEAELMSNSGVKGVLLTRQAAGKEKTTRMVALAKRDPTFLMVVDDPSMAVQLDMAAGTEHTKVNVVVDINAGLQRAGIEPGAKAFALVQKITGLKNLSFKGPYGSTPAALRTPRAGKHAKAGEIDRISPACSRTAICASSPGIPSRSRPAVRRHI